MAVTVVAATVGVREAEAREAAAMVVVTAVLVEVGARGAVEVGLGGTFCRCTGVGQGSHKCCLRYSTSIHRSIHRNT